MQISVVTSFELELPSGLTLADIRQVRVKPDDGRFAVFVVLRGDHPIFARHGRQVLSCDELPMADDVAAAIMAAAQAHAAMAVPAAPAPT